ncbi:hypothetical protein Acsp04_54530 [Actinomadura sp. NBRC 104425]|nr:hypothetical protein Acsp04_54530 [Actinomadura sp. NBRC 104425]
MAASARLSPTMVTDHAIRYSDRSLEAREISNPVATKAPRVAGSARRASTIAPHGARCGAMKGNRSPAGRTIACRTARSLQWLSTPEVAYAPRRTA